jgi:hypothetical protein
MIMMIMIAPLSNLHVTRWLPASANNMFDVSSNGDDDDNMTKQSILKMYKTTIEEWEVNLVNAVRTGNITTTPTTTHQPIASTTYPNLMMAFTHQLLPFTMSDAASLSFYPIGNNNDQKTVHGKQPL